MAGTNQTTLSGRVSRAPQRVRVGGDGTTWGYAFPLAVRSEQGIIFPMVVVEGEELPEFVTYHADRKLHQQPLITIVAAQLRTRNLSSDLADDLVHQARRAGADDELAEQLAAVLGGCGLTSKHVVTDLVVRPGQILEGGTW
jgi:hypothetical protein